MEVSSTALPESEQADHSMEKITPQQNTAGEEMVKISRRVVLPSHMSSPSEEDPADLGEEMKEEDIWPDDFLSQQIGWKQLLVTEKKKKVEKALDYMCKLLGLNEVPTMLNDQQREELKKHIKGLSVIWKHRHQVFIRRVLDVGSEPASECQYSRDGVPTSLVVYYNEHYGKHIRYPGLPTLTTDHEGIAKHIPLELCHIKRGQGEMSPDEQKEPSIIITGIFGSYDQCQARMGATNFTIDEAFPETSVGVTIMQWLSNTLIVSYEADVDEETPRVDVLYTHDLLKWAEPMVIHSWGLYIMAPETSINDEEIMDYINALCQISHGSGLDLPEPSMIKHSRGLNLLKDDLAEMRDLQMVLIIMDGKNPTNLENIKYVGDTKMGLLTKCVTLDTVSQHRQCYLSSMCDDIRCKMEGTNTTNAVDDTWVVREEGLLVFGPKIPTIILGAYVTRGENDKGASPSPSVAGICASTNLMATRFTVTPRLQPGQDPVVQDLQEVVQDMLLQFFRSTKKQPCRIIFFTEGVSDGEFKMLQPELLAIRGACTSLHQDYKPAITFIVVGVLKTIPPVGSNDEYEDSTMVRKVIVNHTITPSKETGFNICYNPRRGKLRPTRYHLLWDDSDLSVSDIAQMCCHQSFKNAMKNTATVRTTTPTHFARKVASRRQKHVKRAMADGVPYDADNMGPLESATATHERLSKNFPMYFA